MISPASQVRKVPQPDSCTAKAGLSFDHLVGTGKQGGRNGKVKRLGGAQINDELELGWLLNWKIRRLGAPQDLIYVGRSAAGQIENARTIRDEASSLNEIPNAIDGRQSVCRCEVDNLFSISTSEWVLDRNQTFWMLDFGSLEHNIEITGTAHLKRLQRNP
jgi:hypothetical protein